MSSRLYAALADGIVLGVKGGAAALVLLVVLSWWAGDYWTLRQQAAHGEQVYRAALAQQEQAKRQASSGVVK